MVDESRISLSMMIRKDNQCVMTTVRVDFNVEKVHSFRYRYNIVIVDYKDEVAWHRSKSCV